MGVHTMLCEMSLEKMQMYRRLVAHGYNCARSRLYKDEFCHAPEACEVSCPVFVNLYRGSAEISISKVYDAVTVDPLFARSVDLMIREFLNGQEIVVYAEPISFGEGSPCRVATRRRQ